MFIFIFIWGLGGAPRRLVENWHKDFGTVEGTEDKGSHSKLVKIWILTYTKDKGIPSLIIGSTGI